MIVEEEFNKKINQVKSLIKNNKLPEAKEICLNIKDYSKKNNEVLNLLGIIELNSKNYEKSLKYFEEAIKINNSDPRIYNNLGILNFKIGKIDKAINFFKKAIEVDKNLIDSYQNLARIKLGQNNYQEAEIYFKKVLEIDDTNLEALISLSDILLSQKKNSENIKILSKLIKLKPDQFEAYNNLGNINLGLHKFDDALKNLIKSNEIKPNKAAYNNIGLIYKEKKDFDLSIYNFNKSLNLDPNFCEPLYNLGIIHSLKGKHEEALEYFNKILIIDKNYQRVLGKILHCKQIICQWDDYNTNIQELKERILNNENCIAPWEALSIFDSEKIQLKAAQTWIKNNYRSYEFPNIQNKNKKIKIGYFSSDFYRTAVAEQIVEMIELHDKEKFEVIGFSLINKKDNLQQRLQNAFDEFINLEDRSNEDIVELCHAINLDIAIDLTGFTLNNRFEIFEKRCAPIQISYLGYSATTGSKNMDYVIADKVVIPEESQKFYPEKIIYMPDFFMVNDSKKKISNSEISKEKYNIPANSFLLGCLNQHYKITPEIFDIWIKILLKNDSVYILLTEGNNLSEENLLKYASKKNINKDRFIFIKKLGSLSEYLNRLKIVDLFIDTFPYGSHTTAFDILIAGKPLVALKGNSFASRISSSLLKSVNLESLISVSFEDYENKINNLIKNKSKLQELNQKIIENKNKATLFDTKKFTKNLETAYLEIYENFINKKNPDNVYID